MGDVKLALFMGAGLGLAVVVGALPRLPRGAVPAIVLLVRHGRAARKQAIALGPFLALGAVIALFAGDAILDWYWVKIAQAAAPRRPISGQMEHAPTPARVSPPVDASLLAVAANRAAAAAAEASEPAQAIDAACGALHETIAGLLPSVFVLEHGRLWLVSQRGYAVVPDGLSVERGIMGRAVRLGRASARTRRSQPTPTSWRRFRES